MAACRIKIWVVELKLSIKISVIEQSQCSYEGKIKIKRSLST